MRYIKEEDYRTLEAIVNRIKERLNKANFFEKFQIRSILKKSLRLLEKAYSNLQAGYEHWK